MALLQCCFESCLAAERGEGFRSRTGLIVNSTRHHNKGMGMIRNSNPKAESCIVYPEPYSENFTAPTVASVEAVALRLPRPSGDLLPNP